MENKQKKLTKRISDRSRLEQIDEKLACGWHVEVEGSGQRKRYLKAAKLSISE